MARTNTTPGRVKLRRKPLKNGGHSLYLDTFVDGVRSYEFLGLYLTGDRLADAQTQRIAEATRTKRELALASAEHNVAIMSSDEDFLAWFDTCAAKTTYRNYRSALKHLRDFTGGKLQMRGVRKELCRQFRDYLLEKCAKSNTAAMYWKCFRVVVREARATGRIGGDPLEGIRSPRGESGERPFLTIEEVRALASAKCTHVRTTRHEEVRRAFLFACFTGLRFGDVRDLTWAQIDARAITVRMEKTNDVVVVPLSDQVREILGARGKRDERVFGISTQGATYRHLERWAAAAGIEKKIGFHTARHTFATLALSADVDVLTVSKLLGHRDLRQTQIYAKLIDRKREEAVAKLPRL
jgi:integrase